MTTQIDLNGNPNSCDSLTEETNNSESELGSANEKTYNSIHAGVTIAVYSGQ